jgi:hypothetical protein
VRAGKEEDARRRATGYLSLPVSYSAGGPGGVPTSTPVVRFRLLFTYYFLDLKNDFFGLPGILVVNFLIIFL